MNTTLASQPQNSDLEISIGMVFGRLAVIDGPFGRSRWRCRCSCAAKPELEVYRSRLIKGAIQSCGCLSYQRLAEHRFKHGYASKAVQHPLYATWEGMKSRCYCKSHSQYSRYGAKGITVCQEWRDSFPAFLAHVGPLWEKGKTLDRIDNTKGYEPGNVKFSSPKEQGNNRKDNVWYDLDGVKYTRAQLCEKFGIHYSTFRSRMARNDDDLKRALGL